MALKTSTPQRLTPKGLATRMRIVEAAANLIYERGVQGTTHEDVREAAGISGSQLAHYFETKESLVRAVIAWRADRVISLSQIPQLGSMDSFQSLRLWADSYIEREDICRGGCSIGSIAAETNKTTMDVREDLAAGFERWEDVFRRGLTAMRDRGELSKEADPNNLSVVLMAAFQGGMLLSQTAQDGTPLRIALDAALAYIHGFAVEA